VEKSLTFKERTNKDNNLEIVLDSQNGPRKKKKEKEWMKSTWHVHSSLGDQRVFPKKVKKSVSNANQL